MSLEESMKEVAESNRELAESNRELAAAQLEYAKTIREYGTRTLVGAGKPSKGDADEEKPKPQTAAEKKAAKAAADKAAKDAAKDEGDDDGFDDDDAGSKTYTHDEVKALLVQVKNTNGDKEEALDLIRPLGYQTIPSIQEKDFAKVAKIAEAWLKKNG